MKLPVLDTFAFPVTVPSTQKEIQMRPYLVREEKLLLMAQESQNAQEQVEAIAQVIRNCTNEMVDPRTAPYFDVEYLLLQLRARSVGEVASPIYVCENPVFDDGVSESRPCKHTTTINVDLSKILVSHQPNPEDAKIVLSPRYTLWVKYPTIYTVNELLIAGLTNAKPNSERAVNSMIDLFDKLHDANGQVYDFAEYSDQDKLEFLEQLPPSDYEKLVEFVEKMPTVAHTIEFDCAKCGYHHVIKLRGLADFLA